MSEAGGAQRLRYGARALAVPAIAGLLSILLVVRIPGNTAWLRALLNASHAPIFAAVAALLATLLRRRAVPQEQVAALDRRRYVLAFLLALVLGILVELLQALSSRPPSLFDVLTDAAGAVIGLYLVMQVERLRVSPSRPSNGGFLRFVALLACAATVFVLWQPLRTAIAYVVRERDFPVLIEFQRGVSMPLLSASRATAKLATMRPEWRRGTADHVLRVRYEPGLTGESLSIRYLSIEPSPDWRGYSSLLLDLANPGSEALELTLRILDARHDWVHDPPPSLPVLGSAGVRTEVRVDLASIGATFGQRPLDLAQIEGLFLFPTRGDVPAELDIAAIRLEK